MASNSAANLPVPSNKATPEPIGPGVVLLVICVGIIGALLVIEIGFRVLSLSASAHAISPTADRPKRFFVPDGPQTLPSQLDILSKKSKGEFRIFAIGDSFTFGQGVQLDDTYPLRLERILNLDNQSQVKAHVINAGVKGASAVQEVETLKRILAKNQPDLIIWQITLNDPELVPFRVSHSYLDEHGRIRLSDFWLKYWKSLGFVIQRVLNSITHRDYINYYFDLFNAPETWGRFSAALTAAKNLAAEKNVPIVAVVFPLFSHDLDQRYPFEPLHKKLNSFLTEINFEHFDLRDSFSKMDHTRLVIEPGQDSHPNEIAHRVAADKIFRNLRERRLVPLALTDKKTIPVR